MQRRTKRSLGSMALHDGCSAWCYAGCKGLVPVLVLFEAKLSMEQMYCNFSLGRGLYLDSNPWDPQ